MTDQKPSEIVKQDFSDLGGQTRQKMEGLSDLPKMTASEENLYQHHLDNILHGGYVQQDSGISTVYNTTVELDGKTYVIPTVWGGKILSPDQALMMARQQGIDKFPSYKSEEEANKRYMNVLHERMQQDIIPLQKIIHYLKSVGIM